MSELKNKKDYIITFLQENINQRTFNKEKVCDDIKYKDIMKNTIYIINNLNEDEVEFHLMLIKYIKNNKVALVDAEYFIESKLDYFVYNDDILQLVNIS